MSSKIDKENTIRSLKDQPLAISSWKCRWGWHTWSRWTDPIYNPTQVYVYQHGECIYCNQKRQKRFGYNF